MQNSTENGEEIIKKEWQNELENPEITEQDYFKKNPSIQSFLEKYYKGKEFEKRQFIESNIKTSIEEFRLSYKYLQNKIGARDLIHTSPYHYLRENTTEEEAVKYADKEALKWRFVFDRINKKYEDRISNSKTEIIKTKESEKPTPYKTPLVKKEVIVDKLDKKLTNSEIEIYPLELETPVENHLGIEEKIELEKEVAQSEDENSKIKKIAPETPLIKKEEVIEMVKELNEIPEKIELEEVIGNLKKGDNQGIADLKKNTQQKENIEIENKELEREIVNLKEGNGKIEIPIIKDVVPEKLSYEIENREIEEVVEELKNNKEELKIFQPKISDIKKETGNEAPLEIDKKIEEMPVPHPNYPTINNVVENNEEKENEENIENKKTEPKTELTKKEISEVNQMFRESIEKLFPTDKLMEKWNYIKNHISAIKLIEMSKSTKVLESFKPLISYLQKLEKITNLHPESATILDKEDETIPHFMSRAMKDAVLVGKKSEIKLD